LIIQSIRNPLNSSDKELKQDARAGLQILRKWTRGPISLVTTSAQLETFFKFKYKWCMVPELKTTCSTPAIHVYRLWSWCTFKSSHSCLINNWNLNEYETVETERQQFHVCGNYFSSTPFRTTGYWDWYKIYTRSFLRSSFCYH